MPTTKRATSCNVNDPFIDTDMFVLWLDSAGGLVYGTYLGGSHTEIGGDIEVTQFGELYRHWLNLLHKL